MFITSLSVSSSELCLVDSLGGVLVLSFTPLAPAVLQLLLLQRSPGHALCLAGGLCTCYYQLTDDNPLTTLGWGINLRIQQNISFMDFFSSCVWCCLGSLDVLSLRTDHPVSGMDFLLGMVGLKLDQSLVAHPHKSCTALPQHILQTRQTVSWRFCGPVNTPFPLLGAMPDYQRLLIQAP